MLRVVDPLTSGPLKPILLRMPLNCIEWVMGSWRGREGLREGGREREREGEKGGRGKEGEREEERQGEKRSGRGGERVRESSKGEGEDKHLHC